MKTQTQSETLPDKINRLNITATFSAPRGEVRDEGTPSAWPCLSYEAELSRGGKPFWSGPYHIGIGHIKPEKAKAVAAGSMSDIKDGATMLDAWKRRPNANYLDKPLLVAVLGRVARIIKHTPTVADVLHSILSDGEVFFAAGGFEEWADEFGYDPDSRRAEAAYRECMETGRKLSRAFTHAEIEALRDAAIKY